LATTSCGVQNKIRNLNLRKYKDSVVPATLLFWRKNKRKTLNLKIFSEKVTICTPPACPPHEERTVKILLSVVVMPAIPLRCPKKREM